MGAIAAVLLAAYFGLALFAGFSPSNDPQRGMAQGFIIFVALVLLMLAALLYLGIVRRRPWLIRSVFALTVVPALSLIAQETYLLVHRAR